METLTSTIWKTDVSHTDVTFKVKHLVIMTVTGKFQNFSGTLTSNREDFDGAAAEFQIETASLDTHNNDRNNHLKSDDFFNAEKYPYITFKNGVLKKVNGSKYSLTGDLTIRETTKNLSFDVEYNGTVKDPWGNTKAGFEINGVINRKDFGLVWNVVAEAGTLLVGEEVKISISTELHV